MAVLLPRLRPIPNIAVASYTSNGCFNKLVPGGVFCIKSIVILGSTLGFLDFWKVPYWAHVKGWGSM